MEDMLPLIAFLCFPCFFFKKEKVGKKKKMEDMLPLIAFLCFPYFSFKKEKVGKKKTELGRKNPMIAPSFS